MSDEKAESKPAPAPAKAQTQEGEKPNTPPKSRPAQKTFARDADPFVSQRTYFREAASTPPKKDE